MKKTATVENDSVHVYTYEFLQVHSLCDELMNHLCQAKAMLTPFDEEDFIHCFGEQELKHYFYALDTIITAALEAKDEINRVINDWEAR